MAISLQKLRSDLSLKDAAISTERIILCNVNYLYKRKISQYSRDLFCS